MIVGTKNIADPEPTLLIFPRGRTHSFAVNPGRGADLVCRVGAGLRLPGSARLTPPLTVRLPIAKSDFVRYRQGVSTL